MADPHHADASDDYVRGSQHIDEQASTFTLFVNMAKWGSLLSAVSIVFLLLWFMPGGSFMAGAISAVVVAVVGVFLLRSKKTAKH